MTLLFIVCMNRLEDEMSWNAKKNFKDGQTGMENLIEIPNPMSKRNTSTFHISPAEGRLSIYYW